MIKKLLFLCAALVVFSMNAKAEETLADKKEEQKILVAYYSVSGNTKKVAEAIQKDLGGDLYQIETINAYPENYGELIAQAKREISTGYRPKLKEPLPDFGKYDMVFIGSPNWWGTITPAVSTFIESGNLAGKTIVLFVTHGGGGEQNTLNDFKRQCEGCLVKDDAWIGYGSRTFGISGWLKDMGFKE